MRLRGDSGLERLAWHTGGYRGSYPDNILTWCLAMARRSVSEVRWSSLTGEVGRLAPAPAPALDTPPGWAGRRREERRSTAATSCTDIPPSLTGHDTPAQRAMRAYTACRAEHDIRSSVTNSTDKSRSLLLSHDSTPLMTPRHPAKAPYVYHVPKVQMGTRIIYLHLQVSL